MLGMGRCGAALLAAVTAIGVAGCSRAVDGTAIAGPGMAGAGVGADPLSTTCREYVAMRAAERRAVLAAIGADGNDLVEMNPDLWVGVAAALCSFADPGAPVRDMVTGGMR
jgi:hypothetical protein